jgi:hypothetical protein
MPPKRPATSQTPDHTQQANGEGSFANGDEFTHVVRKRLSTSTRTGQACDRCKVSADASCSGTMVTDIATTGAEN